MTVVQEKQTTELPDLDSISWEEAIKTVESPKQVQKYLDKNFRYDFWAISKPFPLINIRSRSFSRVYEHPYGVCLDYAIMASAFLVDDGYDPTILVLEADEYRHAIYVYKTDEGYKTINYELFDIPTMQALDNIVSLYTDSSSTKYNEAYLIDLDKTYGRKEWMEGRNNLQRLRTKRLK